jgi:hypothetical protein
MDDLERQLRQAMARKGAPDWFAAKVLEAAASRPAKSWTGFWSPRWAVVAAAALVLMGGVEWQRERKQQERAAGIEAKAKLELALKITRIKLRRIGQQLEAVQERN